jgi:hypothetical protein
MTKVPFVLFNGVFISNADGSALRYLFSDLSNEDRALLGKATSMRIAVQTRSRTGTARLVIRFYETSGPRRPTALGTGYQPFFTSPNIDTSTPVPMNITGPFCDNVDFALDVSDSGAAALQSWDGVITVVLFFN